MATTRRKVPEKSVASKRRRRKSEEYEKYKLTYSDGGFKKTHTFTSMDEARKRYDSVSEQGVKDITFVGINGETETPISVDPQDKKD